MEEIEFDFDNLDLRTLQKAICEVFKCIQNSQGQVPYVTIFNDEIMTIELDDRKFRIEIKDVRRWQ
jgi:hypothetical protein